MPNPVFTIGHSTHSTERFITLLKFNRVSAICDVRSSPYSRMAPQFNREALAFALKKNGIEYVFLGKELGARSTDSSCYVNGKVQYDRLARTDLFQKGIERVKSGMSRFQIALMCAEKDPLECHRSILISRQLDEAGIAVEHIQSDGSRETHAEAVARLRRNLKHPEQDLFQSPIEVRRSLSSPSVANRV